MSASDDTARFWPWFQANGDRLLEQMYGTDNDARAAAFDELREAFEEIQPGVWCLNSPVRRGRPRMNSSSAPTAGLNESIWSRTSLRTPRRWTAGRSWRSA